jgi:hypothetical protein
MVKRNIISLAPRCQCGSQGALSCRTSQDRTCSEVRKFKLRNASATEPTIFSLLNVPCRSKASASKQIRWRAQAERTRRCAASRKRTSSAPICSGFSCEIVASHLIIDAVAAVADGARRIPFPLRGRLNRASPCIPAPSWLPPDSARDASVVCRRRW